MTNVVVNNALGLTQYLTKYLEEPQAVSYLLAIQGLDIEDWRAAKDLLPGAVTTNRQWKEGHIKDCVTVFCNKVVNTAYVVSDLSLIPGFDRSNLHLATYIAAAAQGVKTISSRMIEHQSAKRTTEQRPVQVSPTTGGTSSETLPPRNNNNNHLPPNSVWARQGPRPRGRGREPSKDRDPPPRTWVHGKGDSRREPALVSICLAVKSGADETKESLTESVSKFKYRETTVEAVSKSSHCSVFRVKFRVPLADQDQWMQSSKWPNGASVSLWKGNPNSTLKPISDRIYRKCIYIGNCSPQSTEESIVSNIKHVYKKEIEENVIDTVEAIMNREATEYTMNKSFCVVLTSHRGKPLDQVTLNLHLYPYHLRRSVRIWRGHPPWPENHEMTRTQLKLNW